MFIRPGVQHGVDGSVPEELYRLSDPQYVADLAAQARREKARVAREEARAALGTTLGGDDRKGKMKLENDPFQLIPCLPFGLDKQVLTFRKSFV